MRWSRGMTVVVIAVAMAAVACEKGSSGGERAQSKKAYVGSEAGRAGAGSGAADEVYQLAAPAPAAVATNLPSAEVAEPTDQLPSATRDSATPAMIIRTGTATIKVDSLEPAVVRLRALALSVGGYVGNTSMQTGTDQLRSATVEIKVPAARWGQLVAGLKPIGTLEAENENAQDVGEE